MIGDILQNIFGAIGALVVAGGGGAVVTIFLMKLFAEGWLNAKFEQQLQSQRHEQDRAIEELRFKINSMFDRKTKLHQREFEIVPDAWSKLVEAHAQVTGFISFLQSYPDVNRMTPAQLDGFLKGSNLESWQQDELRDSGDKNKYYQKARFFQRSSECRQHCRELHVYIKKNGIFLPKELKESFSKLDGFIYSALIEHEINQEVDVRPMVRTAKDALEGPGQQLLDDMELKVRQRLWEE